MTAYVLTSTIIMIKPIFFLVFFVSVPALGQRTLLTSRSTGWKRPASCGFLQPLPGYLSSLIARLKIVDPNPYFARVVQETIYEVEKNGWSKFTLGDFNQTLNDITHTNFHVTGEVSYFNGFLVSIEKIDVSDMSPSIASPVVGNETVTTATVRGNINFRDARVGYDVITNVDNDDRQRRYTGVFTHSLIQGRFQISKNMNTNEISLTTSLVSVSGGTGVRMVYMPTDEISEILSLRFSATSSFDSADRWMRENIGSFMLDVARNKIPFPKVCFNC